MPETSVGHLLPAPPVPSPERWWQFRSTLKNTALQPCHLTYGAHATTSLRATPLPYPTLPSQSRVLHPSHNNCRRSFDSMAAPPQKRARHSLTWCRCFSEDGKKNHPHVQSVGGFNSTPQAKERRRLRSASQESKRPQKVSRRSRVLPASRSTPFECDGRAGHPEQRSPGRKMKVQSSPTDLSSNPLPHWGGLWYHGIAEWPPPQICCWPQNEHGSGLEHNTKTGNTTNAYPKVTVSDEKSTVVETASTRHKGKGTVSPFPHRRLDGGRPKGRKALWRWTAVDPATCSSWCSSRSSLSSLSCCCCCSRCCSCWHLLQPLAARSRPWAAGRLSCTPVGGRNKRREEPKTPNSA